MDNSRVIYVGYYDKEKYKFMLKEKSTVSFEDLYKNSEKKIKDKKNNELISEENIPDIKYIYNNPHEINFTFLDDTKKNIFISNMRQFLHINREIANGKELRLFISNDGINYNKSVDMNQSYSSKYVKYTISSINEADYLSSTSYVDVNAQLSLKALSLNYGYYLENTDLVENKNDFFSNTEQRKNFFEFLDNKLEDNKYLALCGLEGIGKTTSILAYLKYSTKTYFYFNVKTIDKLLENAETAKIKDILLKEMYHFIEFKQAKNYYDFIDELLEKSHTAMDIFKHIFGKIKDDVEIIVLDQYKTKYDLNYSTLTNILNSEYTNKIIIISSMNEDDIRKAIIISLKWALKISDKKPILDYYYIIELVKVRDTELNVLKDDEKKLLNEFGNLYIYYYKIKNEINRNTKYDLNIIFKNEIKKEMDNKIKEFFYNSQNSDLLDTFINLILNDDKEIELKNCIEIIDKIPLRYFIFKHKDMNIIHFSELNSVDKISFNSAFIYIREYFLHYFHSIITTKANNDLNKSNEKNQDSINLERFFGYFLWAFRGVTRINQTNIVDYILINSLIDMKDEFDDSFSSKIKKLNNNECLLILQKDQNAKMFDIGILEKKNGKFNLYLIQVTNKKDSDERITITGLNDNANYLNGYFISKFQIEFQDNYFCYIFNYNDPDTTTIDYCQKNNLDYLSFDSQKLILYGNLSLKPLYYYLPAFKYIEQLSNIERMINIEKIQFSDCKENLEEKLKVTKNFLNRKRELLRSKESKIKEIDDLLIYECSLKNVKKTPTNYERKEFIINNYLLSNEYKNEKIYGISYKRKKSDIKFKKKEVENLFELCGKNKGIDEIFQVDKLKILHFNQLKPEFGCYIVFKSFNKKKYYFNFISNKYIDLEDKSEDSFAGKKLIGQGDFYSIMFLNKNINIS